VLDRELNDMIGTTGLIPEKRFTYVRYNAELSKEGLKKLGCGHIDPAPISDLAAVSAIPQLREVGKAVAKEQVKAAHFEGFLD
jgi:hypothetical protein